MPQAAVAAFSRVGGVGKNDVGRLAAQLQPDALEIGVGGVAQVVAADAGGSGEGQDVDVRVQADRAVGDRTVAGDDVERTRGQSGLGADAAQQQGWQRGRLGRLQDDGAACGEGRGDLPAGQGEREVPWCDRADHTGGLARDHGEGVGDGVRGLVGELVGQLPVPAECVDDGAQFYVLRVGDGLAHHQANRERQFLAPLFEDFGDPQQDPAAVGGGQARPGSAFEGAAYRP